MIHCLSACSLLLLAPLAAQQLHVVPARAATSSDGHNWGFYSFWGASSGSGNGHVQSLYATSEIPLTAGTLTGLAVRRSSAILIPNAATTLRLQLDLSHTPLAATAAGSTFAANHGSDRTRVLDAVVNLPARAAGAWPAPWEAPIQFATPFPYQASAGNALVVDLVTSQNSAAAPWYTEVTTVGYGSLAPDFIQNTCTTSDGGLSGSYGSLQRQPYVGGTLSLSLLGMPSRVPTYDASRLVFGTQGRGGSFGGLPLPFALQSVGVPARPNCQWAIDMVFDLPLVYTPGRSQNQGILSLGPLPIPNDPTLAGVVWFTQGLALDQDPVTNQLQVFTTMSHRWVMGTGATVPATTVYAIQDTVPGAATGTVLASEAPTLQLRFL